MTVCSETHGHEDKFWNLGPMPSPGSVFNLSLRGSDFVCLGFCSPRILVWQIKSCFPETEMILCSPCTVVTSWHCLLFVTCRRRQRKPTFASNSSTQSWYCTNRRRLKKRAGEMELSSSRLRHIHRQFQPKSPTNTQTPCLHLCCTLPASLLVVCSQYQLNEVDKFESQEQVVDEAAKATSGAPVCGGLRQPAGGRQSGAFSRSREQGVWPPDFWTAAVPH